MVGVLALRTASDTGWSPPPCGWGAALGVCWAWVPARPSTRTPAGSTPTENDSL